MLHFLLACLAMDNDDVVDKRKASIRVRDEIELIEGLRKEKIKDLKMKFFENVFLKNVDKV